MRAVRGLCVEGWGEQTDVVGAKVTMGRILGK